LELATHDLQQRFPFFYGRLRCCYPREVEEEFRLHRAALGRFFDQPRNDQVNL
jgi:hypothetical protein